VHKTNAALYCTLAIRSASL